MAAVSGVPAPVCVCVRSCLGFVVCFGCCIELAKMLLDFIVVRFNNNKNLYKYCNSIRVLKSFCSAAGEIFCRE